ncbi:MAG: NAD-dependent protein deacylase, partial [Clostridiales Family XIII bacterium]|nr:NAD-dependent protein deacylase [Clostridiales Family XIII bacterium]
KAKQKYGRSPESIISHSSFLSDTELFFDYYKQNMLFADAQPNKAHKALAKLEAQGKLKAVVTQNIDGLHQVAGSKTVFELHGSIHRNTCMNCDAPFDLPYVLKPENCLDAKGKQTSIPRCNLCGGTIKPDVVLYEEPLNENTVYGAIRAISAADTLIVGGTSLVVYPAAGYLEYFNGKNLVLINKSQTSFDRRANLVIHDPIGEVLSIFL